MTDTHDETRIYALHDDGVRVERATVHETQNSTQATYTALTTDVSTAGVLINDRELGCLLAGDPDALEASL